MAIKKNVSVALVTGDILAGQIIGVVYDGANFQMIPVNVLPATTTTLGSVKPDGTTITFDANGVISANVIEIIQNFVVNAGQSVTANDIVEFVNGGIEKVPNTPKTTMSLNTTPLIFEYADVRVISTCALSSTSVLVCYQDVGNSYYGTAVVLTVTGTILTAGTPVVFSANSSSDFITTTALDSTRAIVAFSNQNINGLAMVLTISGTSITVGTGAIFQTGRLEYLYAVALTTSTALVAYSDFNNSSRGMAVILSAPGNTVTVGTPVVFYASYALYITACKLSDTEALIGYSYSSIDGEAVALTISGTTITVGTPVSFSPGRIYYRMGFTMLTDSAALIAYCDYPSSSYGTAVVLTVVGTVITVGTRTVFSSADTREISALLLSNNKVAVAYVNAGNTSKGTAVILTISGTTITVGTPVIVANTNTGGVMSTVKISDSKAVTCYQNYSGSSYGTAGLIYDLDNLLGSTAKIYRHCQRNQSGWPIVRRIVRAYNKRIGRVGGW